MNGCKGDVINLYFIQYRIFQYLVHIKLLIGSFEWKSCAPGKGQMLDSDVNIWTGPKGLLDLRVAREGIGVLGL